MSGKRLSLNKFFLLFLAIGFTICCSEQRQETSIKKTGIIELSYWCASNPREKALATELVAEWNSQNDSVKVRLQPIPSSQSSEEVLLAAIAANTTPDICSNMWPGAMDDFISSGGLVRLSRFADFQEYLRQRVPENLLNSFRAIDGHFYQLPWKTNPVMVVYNKDLFEKAGVETPLKTYTEYLAAAEKLTLDKDGDGKIDQWMAYRNVKPIWWQRLFDFYPLYIAASGGKTLFDPDGTLNFNNIHSVQVFSFLSTAYEKKYFPITDFQGDKFLAGQLATQFTGPYFISYVKQYKNMRVGVMPVPVPDNHSGQTYTLGDFKNISIFSNTKYPEHAWSFAKTLISRKADLRLLQLASQIPVRKNLTSDSMFIPYFEQNPELLPFAEQSVFTRGVDGVSDLKEILDIISQEYESSVIYDYSKPQAAVKTAAERVRVIMEWNRN